MAVNVPLGVEAHESDPLLPKSQPESKQSSKSALYKCLLCAFIVSLSFGVTQIPLVYVFRVMTCDAYYDKHPKPPPSFRGDRCSNHQIEASTAISFAIIGASTTVFGLFNLFVTGWLIKRIGIKSTLAIQVFWPAIRLLIQNIGVFLGKDLGIAVLQSSQIITIIGGPLGYMLALNSMITEVVETKERTGGLGKLQGCMFIGSATGCLAGGLIAERFGIQAPFVITLALFVLSSIYVVLVLPGIPLTDQDDKKTAEGLGRFFGPFKIFAPQKWTLADGRTQIQYGALFLGIGNFLAILATGYIPIMLQMFATDVFGFGTAKNSWMVFLNSFLRGMYLTLVFPSIIKIGRRWTSPRDEAHTTSEASTLVNAPTEELPTEPDHIEAGGPMEDEQEPIKVPNVEGDKDGDQENYAFDLLYAKASLFADGMITGAATFVTQGWEIYLVAGLLPFAAGTGAAAKGTILQMCSKEERIDALTAITLVENMARLSTIGVFGLVFAAFANIGKQHLVFTCNAAVALLGCVVLLFCRFPPKGGRRHREEDRDHET